jgi:hypothetical protein
VAALGLACLDLAPWALVILPLAVLALHLAVRAAGEWPRVGFPACILGVGLFTVAAGLFRAGIGWSREWDSLRNAGAVTADPGAAPTIGLALAIFLGGSFLGILFLHGGVVWRTLSSIRLAVVTLASIGTLSIIGTMVVQRLGAGALPGPEKEFVEKFLKGQGSMPVSARFILAPPKVEIAPAEEERLTLVGKAFGEGKERQLRLGTGHNQQKGRKELDIENHVAGRREHLLRLFERADALGLTMVFRTWWFNALLVLLFVQVTAVLSKRYPWGWGQAGWVLTHVGVLVVLVGCTVSDLFLRDGALGLSPGEDTDRFEDYTKLDSHGKPVKTELGYGVKMLGTDETFYHEIWIGFPGVRAGDDVLMTQEQLRPGRRIPVKQPDGKASYEVRILEVHERALFETALVSAKAAGREGGSPVLRVAIQDGRPEGGGKTLDEGYLFPDGFYTGRIPSYAMQYRRAATAEEARDLLAGKVPAGHGKHGLLEVRAPGFAEPVRVPATPGEKVTAVSPEGTSWTFEVERYNPSYWVDGPPADEDPTKWPDRPALEVLVRRGVPNVDGGAVGRTVVYAEPRLQAQLEEMFRQGDESGHGGTPAAGWGPAAECSYRFEFEPAVQTWIVEGPGIERTLVVRRRGAPVETAPLAAPGASGPVGLPGIEVRLLEAIPDAVEDQRIQPLPQETDSQYVESCLHALETGAGPPPLVSAAKVEVLERDAAGERTRTEWLVAEKKGLVDGRVFHSTDGELAIVMVETRNTLMYRSALEVLSLDGKPILVDGKPFRHVVRVNNPLKWGGYAFYQNSFLRGSAGEPNASVFRVKYDRGIPILYSGFVILVAGVFMMLYVNPMLRKRRGIAAAAPTEGGGA